VLIIPNIYLGHAIGLMKKWKQEYCIYDGLMIYDEGHKVTVTQLDKPSFFLSKEDKNFGLSFTEVILEGGEKARFRYA